MIHPNHLMDGAQRGALSPDAWRKLGAHLAACGSCAWERAATDDFARERSASEDDLGDDGMRALLDGALARAGVPSLPRAEVARRPWLARWLGAGAMVAAAAAVMLAPLLRDTTRPAPREEASVAVVEAGLDAGALGTPSGGDS